MKKKLLSILLALTLSMTMMSAFAVTSFADDTQAPAVTAVQTVDNNAGFKLPKISLKVSKVYPLIGVNLNKIYKDTNRNAFIKNSVSLVKAISKINWKKGTNNWNEVKNALNTLGKTIKIEAEDVVLFSIDKKHWSPVLVAKEKDMVYVKANQFSNAAQEKNNMDPYLTSTKVSLTKDPDATSEKSAVYYFSMPSKVVTAADFTRVQSEN